MTARILRKLIAGSLTAVALATSQPTFAQKEISKPTETERTATKLTNKQLNEYCTRGAVWIMFWHDGLSYSAHGSGWVLDAKKRLIVTNEHVVHGNDNVEIFFPQWNGDKVNRDYQEYLQHGKSVKGKVIDRDHNRDLALVQVDEVPSTAWPLKIAEQPAEEGDMLRTVGGLPRGNEALWGTVSGEVRLVAKRRNANGGYGMMVVTSMPTNSGNSGGAIVNEKGEVVAVVEGGYNSAGADGQMTLSVTLHVDLSELKAYLAEALPLVEPKDAETFTKRGQRRLNEGRNDVAAADFSEAIKRDAKNVAALIGRGKTFAAKKDFATALIDFDEALKLDESSVPALVARAQSRSATGKVDDAIADMTQAIRLEPNKMLWYNERGNIRHNSGKNYEDAIADYTRAIEMAPNDAVLYSNRANSFERMGKVDEAAADIKKTIDMQPKNDWRWSQLGRLYLWTGKRYEDAYKAFMKANEVNPNEAIHLADIGDTLLEDGQFAKAASAFNDSFDLNRKHATLNMAYTLYRRGLARKGMKDAVGAIADFSQVIKINPKHAHAHLERGQLLQEAGKTSEAKADLDEAAKLDPKLAKATMSMVETEVVEAKGISIVGTWEFGGTLDGAQAWERAVIRDNGTMSSTLRVRGRDGYWREINDSGTYSVSDGKLTVQFKQLGTVVAKIERTGDVVRMTRQDGTVINYALVK
ncbi:MAG TPA: tetratricopeptide repeat protein [Gemmataceae bacterium]|jgi:tetratricopeptide (TPR) repeat protein|nr:tetratricopeptide repeat protein [Gemmataceae bacterium]